MKATPTLVDLYRDRYDPMVRLAYLLVGELAVAEELVQDSFVKLHRRGLDRIDHPNAYLRTTVVNTCRSWGRRHRRERDHHRRRLEAVRDPDFVSDEMWDILATLPERQRTAVVLRYYDDATEATIAEVLSCRPTTVRTLIHRGLAALRKEVPR